MTCIITLEYKNHAYIAADSSAVCEWQVVPSLLSKLATFSLGDERLAIGYTTDFRFGQILQAHLTSKLSDHDPFSSYASTVDFVLLSLIPAMRTVLKDQGYATIDNNHETSGFALLAFSSGETYRLNSDYGITRSAFGFDAVGCGSDYAIGALSFLHLVGKLKPSCFSGVLEAVALTCKGVCAPFTVMKVIS